ncbi:aldo/keto reductase [Halobacteria archaeon HArc-gm2]|nr:aldo/keto reductase [Halobacteria archaeon HArc-gm2]
MPIDSLPRIGLGTYSDDNREQWRDNVRTALDVGYRHVDTAQVYGNEEYVGQAIAESDVDREDLFLSTKTVHVDVPPEPEDTADAIDGCLERLGVDYVDMLYVHWPADNYDPEVVLPAFDEAYEEGKTRNVALSNFSPELLDEAREILDAPIAAHQVECHPLLQQEELREYAVEHDHWLVCYSPLGKGAVFDEPVVGDVAEKHDVSPAQVSLAWLLSKENVTVIPKASSREHMVDNFAARDLELDDEDIQRIDDIDRTYREIDPEHGVWNR